MCEACLKVTKIRIGRDWLENEHRRIGDRWFRQEYLCNPPYAPIWMGDYSFRPIGDVRVGDEVIGWHMPEKGKKQFKRRRLIRATVIGVKRRLADLVEVRLESGRTLVCTPDHQWLSATGGYSSSFNTKEYNNGVIFSRERFMSAKVGNYLSRVIDPTVPLSDSLAWDAAWLGGIYDGEGGGDTIAQSLAHNPEVCQRIEAALASLGIRQYRQDEAYLMTGSDEKCRKQTLVDFANWTKPVRYRSLDPFILKANWRIPDRIIDIRPAGHGEVVSLQTETGNYIVWGYASKNCSFEDIAGAVFSRESIEAAVEAGRNFQALKVTW
jgi:hypothetical protein